MNDELTDSGNSGYDFAELELVKDGGFTGGVESYHQNAHLPLGKKPIQ